MSIQRKLTTELDWFKTSYSHDPLMSASLREAFLSGVAWLVNNPTALLDLNSLNDMLRDQRQILLLECPTDNRA